MVVKEIRQEARRHLGPLRSTATRYLGDTGVQIVKRQLAVFLNKPLHTVALGAVDQRVLKLLGIDQWRVLRQQRNNVIGRDHVFHDALVFEQADPGGQPILLRFTCRRIFGSSRAHQFAGVIGDVHPGVEGICIDLFAVEGTQIQVRMFGHFGLDTFPDFSLCLFYFILRNLRRRAGIGR